MRGRKDRSNKHKKVRMIKISNLQSLTVCFMTVASFLFVCVFVCLFVCLLTFHRGRAASSGTSPGVPHCAQGDSVPHQCVSRGGGEKREGRSGEEEEGEGRREGGRGERRKRRSEEKREKREGKEEKEKGKGKKY